MTQSHGPCVSRLQHPFEDVDSFAAASQEYMCLPLASEESAVVAFHVGVYHNHLEGRSEQVAGPRPGPGAASSVWVTQQVWGHAVNVARTAMLGGDV